MSEAMSAERLAEIKALTDAATPGPWELDGYSLFAGNGYLGDLDLHDVADRAFLGAARTAVPELLAEVERLNAVLDGATVFSFGDYDVFRTASTHPTDARGVWHVDKIRLGGGLLDRDGEAVQGSTAPETCNLTREEAIALARRLAGEATT